jgi:hypothetical protein
MYARVMSVRVFSLTSFCIMRSCAEYHPMSERPIPMRRRIFAIRGESPWIPMDPLAARESLGRCI